jgi:hypothetical protein
VGYGLEPSKAAEVLQQAIGFFELLFEAELALAEEPAETDLTPCGARGSTRLQRMPLPCPST